MTLMLGYELGRPWGLTRPMICNPRNTSLGRGHVSSLTETLLQKPINVGSELIFVSRLKISWIIIKEQKTKRKKGCSYCGSSIITKSFGSNLKH